MVNRVYVEKRPEFDTLAANKQADLIASLGLTGLNKMRIIHRYDTEGLDAKLFEKAKRNIFSEPQVDHLLEELPQDADFVLAVEPLPGQYDQRADSAAQCIQMLSRGERPIVKSAEIYLFYGQLTDAQKEAVTGQLLNPVESRKASLELPETLQSVYDVPADVAVLEGFTQMDEAALDAFIKEYGLAMDRDDLRLCRDYFASENRQPTLTEIRVLDTYWSDHCRHTTFTTHLTELTTDDKRVQKTLDTYLELHENLRPGRPITLMDLATIGAKALKEAGKLEKLDESEEINACTVKISVDVNGQEEDWLLLFKNETHNHPTEIEPFGGAATCIGGAIRDPLSGRSYVYQAMRVTGAADPTVPLSATMPGKLSQKKLVTTAAAGYSSYGNQIGLATGLVDELYHPGYAAKRMEIGAVVGAAPAKNVVREVPASGDVVVLLGGKTGRDGCGGATGSSKSHDMTSLVSCGAEVQKGNAPEERKLQRLFRNETAARMIKRCNDFGAGGVSVAIGELADGLRINLNAVPKKYEGLDGTELAISESQERMAVVLAPENVAPFMALAASENLEATVVAEVTEEPRLVMHWRDRVIVDLSRAFLNENGARKQAKAYVVTPEEMPAPETVTDFAEAFKSCLSDLNVCDKRGLCERFDATIGAGSVLMPFGGKRQKTPAQAMACKLPVLGGETETASVMAYGFSPYLSENDPYAGAYSACAESVAKMLAVGATREESYFTFQEYFRRMTGEKEVWGMPAAALLGALQAQLDLGIAAIGGKDSMSGNFESLHVPNTLVSFAVTTLKAGDVTPQEMKQPGSSVYLLRPKYEGNMPEKTSMLALFDLIQEQMAAKNIISAYVPTFGGAAAAVFKMCLGNGLGFEFDAAVKDLLFDDRIKASFVVEVPADKELPVADNYESFFLGHVKEEPVFVCEKESVSFAEAEKAYESTLSKVFATTVSSQGNERVEKISYEASKRVAPAISVAKPRVLIPVFPGTNCEYDSAKAFEKAGAEAEIFVINNLSASDVARSVDALAARIDQSQIVFLPGGFSGGDEPEGSGKFITSFFRNEAVSAAVSRLLEERDGLMGGICNGFQALIKLGLVPYGRITEPTEECPTLTFNCIGRHQSRLVTTRIASNKSPWLSEYAVGDLVTMPISHGEGRFVCEEGLFAKLVKNGQIATQYVDDQGNPTMDILYNPNGSVHAVEGISSPDGRVFGKMGHSERYGKDLYRNTVGEDSHKIFTGAVRYFK